MEARARARPPARAPLGAAARARARALAGCLDLHDGRDTLGAGARGGRDVSGVGPLGLVAHKLVDAVGGCGRGRGGRGAGRAGPRGARPRGAGGGGERKQVCAGGAALPLWRGARPGRPKRLPRHSRVAPWLVSQMGPPSFAGVDRNVCVWPEGGGRGGGGGVGGGAPAGRTGARARHAPCAAASNKSRPTPVGV